MAAEDHAGPTPESFDVLVEIPRGSRNKYESDKQTGRIWLDRTLFTSTTFPADYGHIPGTIARDGDPINALVLVAEPTFPGCLVTAKPVGVFWMHDDERGDLHQDTKILCVPGHDQRFDAVNDLSDLPESTLKEIWHFFDVYKDLEPGRSTQITGWGDAREAHDAMVEAIGRFGSRQGAGS
ncbi:MAG: inorganic diphosphatase [Marmoricola sp.]